MVSVALMDTIIDTLFEKDYRNWKAPLSPLNRRGRLAGNVIDHAIHTLHFIDDAVADRGKHRKWNFGPIRSHEVLRFHRANGHHRFITASIAHHADALHAGQQNRKYLIRAAIQIIGDDFLEQNLIAIAEHVEPRGCDFADDSHR